MAFRPDTAARLALLAGKLPESAARPTLWSALMKSQIPLPMQTGKRIRSTSKSAPTSVASSTSTPAGGSSLSVSGASESGAGVAQPLSQIVRHGEGDGILHLDVGGKEFRTLRSTVAQNRVLSDLVSRAESNPELLRDGKAVFVDRDPAHFGLILHNLRNKADGVSLESSPTTVASTSQKLRSIARRTKNGIPSSVKLPVDKSKLAEVYAEAVYFEVEELKEAACYHSFFVWVTSKIGGTANPFDFVSKLAAWLRRGTVAIAGLTAGASTVQCRDSILDALPDGLKAALLPLFLTQQEDECHGENVVREAAR